MTGDEITAPPVYCVHARNPELETENRLPSEEPKKIDPSRPAIGEDCRLPLVVNVHCSAPPAASKQESFPFCEPKYTTAPPSAIAGEDRTVSPKPLDCHRL